MPKRKTRRSLKFNLPRPSISRDAALFILVFLIGVAAFGLKAQRSSSTTTAPQKTGESKPVSFGDFPTYPGATFVNQSSAPACQPGEDMLKTACGSTFYNWSTGDSLEKIDKFYTGEKINGSPWSCAGGTGIKKEGDLTSFGKPCLSGNKVWGVGASQKAGETTVFIHLTAN